VVSRMALLLALLLAACSGEDKRDYLVMGGGGFIFNYRLAEAHYGVVLQPDRDPPPGSVIEARFDNPAGGDPIVMTKPARPGPGRITFDTPPVKGVQKDKDYKVQVVLRDAEGKTLQTLEKSLRSELDQTVLPQGPMTVGPGYQRPEGVKPANPG
jgi:hypothetical protein